MNRRTLIDVYEDGSRVVKVTSDRRYDTVYYFRTPQSHIIDFGDKRRCARLHAALRIRLGSVPIVDNRDNIPLKIALDGNATIASYLYTVHREYYHGLGWASPNDDGRKILEAEMGVSKRTLSKYFRRTVDRAKEFRVDGVGR